MGLGGILFDLWGLGSHRLRAFRGDVDLIKAGNSPPSRPRVEVACAFENERPAIVRTITDAPIRRAIHNWGGGFAIQRSHRAIHLTEVARNLKMLQGLKNAAAG
jgi:hypothetical protein